MTMNRPRKRHALGSLASLSLGLLALGTAACSSSSGSGTSDSGHTTGHDASHSTTSDAGDASSTMQHDGTVISFGDGSTPPHDATPDVTSTTPDVSTITPDAHADTSTVVDGSSADAKDGAVTSDGSTGSKEGGSKEGGASEGGVEDAAKDTGVKDSAKDGATCVAVTVPTGTGGASACKMPEAGTCGPGSLAGFVPTSPPPSGSHQGLCTATQIQNIYNDCLTSGGTCPEQNTGDPGQGCYNCIFTNETDATWGPLVANAANIVTVNVGGCLQILEPCNSACAAAFENDFECEDYACGTNCSKATVMDFETCSTAVDNCDPGGCAAYSVAEECRAQITGTAHPASACFPASNSFETAFLAVAPIFCGN